MEEADAGSSRVFTWQRAVPGTHHQRRSLGGESAAASPAHAQRQCCGLREWRNSPVDSLCLSLSPDSLSLSLSDSVIPTLQRSSSLFVLSSFFHFFFFMVVSVVSQKSQRSKKLEFTDQRVKLKDRLSINCQKKRC